MGRDQYVRVVEPYYFFFVGIETNLVTLTERKVKDSANPQARLYQKKFFATSRPTRTFNDRRMPFRQITLRPSVTPGLDFSTPPPFPPTVAGGVNGRGDDLFWPMVGGARFIFVLDCVDWDGRRKILPTPLLAVAAKLGNLSEKVEIVNAWVNDPQTPIAAAGQSIALAGSIRPGQTAMETVTLRFTGTPGDRGSRTATPRLANADVVIPAMRHLSPGAKAVTVSYAQPYLDHGFEGPNAEPQVFLKLPTPGQIVFDQGTQNAGGFIRPDLPSAACRGRWGRSAETSTTSSPHRPASASTPPPSSAACWPSCPSCSACSSSPTSSGSSAWRAHRSSSPNARPGRRTALGPRGAARRGRRGRGPHRRAGRERRHVRPEGAGRRGQGTARHGRGDARARVSTTSSTPSRR